MSRYHKKHAFETNVKGQGVKWVAQKWNMYAMIAPAPVMKVSFMALKCGVCCITLYFVGIYNTRSL